MSTIFPINFCNRNGIPLMETSSVNVTEANVVLTLTDRSFRWLNDKGLLLFRLNQMIPEGTDETLPIVFSSNDFEQALSNVGGTPITVAQMTSPGVYLIYYDKNANLLQLMTTAIPVATAVAKTVSSLYND